MVPNDQENVILIILDHFGYDLEALDLLVLVRKDQNNLWFKSG